MATFQESGHPIFCGTIPFVPKNAKKEKTERKLRHITLQNPKLQSSCYALLFPSISSVFCGAVADWCEKFTQRAEDHVSPSTGSIGSPRSFVTLVTVDNRLPYVFVQIILLQHGYCTFVIILFEPFSRLFINLTMCE